jgi:hypothetical protein
MPRGHPDWGQYPSITALAVYELSGEQAARLGSPYNTFRDGLACWIEDWRHGLGQWDDQSDPTSALNLVTTPRLGFSPYAAQLAVGAGAGGDAIANVSVPFPPTDSLALTAVYQVSSPADEIRIDADIYTGSRLLRAGWQSQRLSTLNARTGSGTYAAIVPALNDPTLDAGRWAVVQMVIDVAGETYGHWLTNAGLVVPTGPTLNASASTVRRQLDLTLEATQSGGGVAYTVTLAMLALTYDHPVPA